MTLLAPTKETKATAVPQDSTPDVKLSDSEKNTVLGMVASDQEHPTVLGENPSERRAWGANSPQRD